MEQCAGGCPAESLESCLLDFTVPYLVSSTICLQAGLSGPISSGYEAHKYSNIIRSNLVAICHWNFNECIGYSLYDKAFKVFTLPFNTIVEVLLFYPTVNSQSSALRLICSRQISPNS